ncbi:MAG: hypothetical protein HPY50_05220 [Firmicutes bacterium]|nr:hypothetical protein [Bacillota bacterium]
MKKKYLSLIAVLIIGLILSTAAAASADLPIRLMVNGKEVAADVPPQNINGRVLVPVRFVAEALGATVEWNGASSSVFIKTPDAQNAPVVDSGASPAVRLFVNGRQIAADVPPQNIGGRILVPIRFVAEALGAEVNWDGPNNLVTITSRKPKTYTFDKVRVVIKDEGLRPQTVHLDNDTSNSKVSGEIKNDSRDKTYRFINTTITFYDQDGRAVSTKSYYTDSVVLAPGQSTTFSANFSSLDLKGASMGYFEVVVTTGL